MKRIECILAASLFLALGQPSRAMDFLEKHECTLERPGRALLHTHCVFSGGISDGVIDADLETPDGKHYPVDGPSDGSGGHVYGLQSAKARRTTSNGGDCFAREDGKLEICVGQRID